MLRTCAKYAVVAFMAASAGLGGALGALAQNSVDEELTGVISRLSPEQKDALLLLLKGIVDAEANAESPEDGAMKTVKAYVEAAEEADLERIMAQVSESFSHYEVGNKAGYRAFLEQVKNDGRLEDITGNVEGADATVEGESVTVQPVELEGLFGTVTLKFELEKDGEAWKITGIDMEGV